MVASIISFPYLRNQLAKALINDAARTNSLNTPISNSLGYGIVPIDINDIISSNDDEIKFVLTGTTQNQVTNTYNLPVPVVDNKHPYKARASLVYFTLCDRAQGLTTLVVNLSLNLEDLIPKIHLANQKSKI
uniref:hypothetical protein n=1 Tax=Succinivibrio sp. TaxID=2053619 RepID=UPI00402AC28B